MTADNHNPLENHDAAGERLSPLGDPVLDPLLDEALAPHAVAGGVPADLAGRIVARTQPMLKGRRGVLARIGPVRLATALAALLAIAASIGLVMRWGAPRAEPRPLAVELQTGLGPLVYAADESIDRDLALLAHQIDSAGRPIDWDSTSRIEELDGRLDAGDEGAVF